MKKVEIKRINELSLQRTTLRDLRIIDETSWNKKKMGGGRRMDSGYSEKNYAFPLTTVTRTQSGGVFISELVVYSK